MKSLQELQAIRDKMKANISTTRDNAEAKVRVVVGMATCGIAAGARPVLNAFNEEKYKEITEVLYSNYKKKLEYALKSGILLKNNSDDKIYLTVCLISFKGSPICYIWQYQHKYSTFPVPPSIKHIAGNQ